MAKTSCIAVNKPIETSVIDAYPMLPMAVAAVSSKPPYRCAGNLFATAIWAYTHFALAWLFYQKIWAFGQENRTDGKSNRTNIPPQARPGSLNRTLLVSIMIYGGGWKI